MADEDSKYVEHVRRQPCAVCAAMPPSHPHHSTHGGMQQCAGCGNAHALGPRGKSTRAHDHETIPLCWKHHRQFHDATGHFQGWTRQQRHEWQDAEVKLYQERYFDSDSF